MSYSLSQASKIMIPKEFCHGKNQRDNLIQELATHRIIERGNWNNYYQKDKWVLNVTMVDIYPELKEYFEVYITPKGFYQLKITELGIENLINFMYNLEMEVK